jgi:O-antigen ligase
MPDKSFHAWFFKWGEGVLLFFFAQVLLNKEQLRALLAVFLVSTTLVVINGFYQKFTGMGFLRRFNLIQTDRFVAVRSSFNHFNSFASFLVAMFFVTAGFLAVVKKWWLKLALTILAILIICNIFFTYSRGGWLAFIFGCMYLILFCGNRKTKLLFLIFGLVFIICLFSIPVLKNRVMFSFYQSGDAGRFKMWAAAWQMFKENPLTGKGLGLFMDYLPRYTDLGAQYTHNCYLQILAESGFLGLASFLWFLGVIIVRGYKRVKAEKEAVFTGVFIALLAFIVHTFFDTQLYSLKLSIFFWVLSAYIAKYINANKRIVEESYS